MLRSLKHSTNRPFIYRISANGNLCRWLLSVFIFGVAPSWNLDTTQPYWSLRKHFPTKPLLHRRDNSARLQHLFSINLLQQVVLCEIETIIMYLVSGGAGGDGECRPHSSHFCGLLVFETNLFANIEYVSISSASWLWMKP